MSVAGNLRKELLNYLDDRGALYLDEIKSNTLLNSLTEIDNILEAQRRVLEVPLRQLSRSSITDLELIELRKAEGE